MTGIRRESNSRTHASFKPSSSSLVKNLLSIFLLIGKSSHVATSHARLESRLSSALMVPPGGAIAEDFIRLGHSHNDYHQENPLSSALKHGLNSVEVDVFPRQDKLFVAHTVFELDAGRTIENLYISPILRMLRQSGIAASDPRVTLEGDSRPFPRARRSQRRRFRMPLLGQRCGRTLSPLLDNDEKALTLLVDFKADAEKSATLLHEAIAPLRPYLSKVDRNGKLHKGRITVIVSGNRPRAESLISKDGDRFIFIDGRSHDIYSESDTNLVPLVSVPWRRLQVARWVGRGDRYMRHLSKKAHDQGKLLRIWGAPNSEYLWTRMVQNDVDLLSIDDHSKFARFASQVGFAQTR